MPKEMSIHKMIDQVFDKKANSVIDEIVEERTFILNSMKSWISDDEMWKQFVDEKDLRKVFIWQVQALTLQELESNALIELVTIKQGEE